MLKGHHDRRSIEQTAVVSCLALFECYQDVNGCVNHKFLIGNETAGRPPLFAPLTLKFQSRCDRISPHAK